MSDSIPAIYDSGVFRPLEPVNLPEGTRAEVVPLDAAQSTTWPTSYFEQTAGALTSERFERPPQGDLPHRNHW